ncbi:MAG: hypothetical protein IJF69_06120 [Clostridia bacterium]|nr:hypothetical protein [Clostridia bacterium]
MKKVAALLLAVLMMLSLCSCSFIYLGYKEVTENKYLGEAGDINIIYEESWFSGAERVGDRVVYTCVITMENTGMPKSVVIFGDFTEEFDAGIITESSLFGTIVGSDGVFGPGEKKALSVTFEASVCEGYDGEALKCDRNLPEIAYRVDLVE